jgi:hypothetical protein
VGFERTGGARDENAAHDTAIAGQGERQQRLTWMMIGPIVLLFTIYAIVTNGGGWFTIGDAAYGAVVALMVGGRWMEQRSGAATTVTGDPATIEHSKRYVRILLPVAAGAWVAANVLGNHLLT